MERKEKIEKISTIVLCMALFQYGYCGGGHDERKQFERNLEIRVPETGNEIYLKRKTEEIPYFLHEEIKGERRYVSKEFLKKILKN